MMAFMAFMVFIFYQTSIKLSSNHVLITFTDVFSGEKTYVNVCLHKVYKNNDGISRRRHENETFQ